MSHPYRMLSWMLLAHFLIMFAVMYSMVFSIDDLFWSLSKFYMTVLMVLPMALMMPLMMQSNYPNSSTNRLIYVASLVLFLVFLWLIRGQFFMTDRQFLKSMIPHHSAAILMCERAPISDLEIRQLCKSIILSQQVEIDQMKHVLHRLENQ